MVRTPRNKQIDEAVIAASEREQRLVGEVLHETICQNLCAASLLLQTVLRRVQAGKHVEAGELEELCVTLDRAIEQTRALSRQLNPKELAVDNLASALKELARITSGTAACTFEGDPTILLNEASHARALYRIAQEAVRNALQHAGGDEIAIRLVQRNNRVVMEVRDNGHGFPPDKRVAKGGGINLIRRHLAMSGGDLTVQSVRGGGTIVRCTFPNKK